MNTPTFEFVKTDACKLLEQYFPSFKCSVSFTEIVFLHEMVELECGLAAYEKTPIGFILRDINGGSAVVFLRENDDLLFHGFFDDSVQAYDYACDRLIMELYHDEYQDLAGEVTPVDFTASQQDTAPVSANAPAEGQPQTETVYCPQCDYHSATATQADGVRNICCSYCGLDMDVNVKTYEKLPDADLPAIRIELSTKTGDNS